MKSRFLAVMAIMFALALGSCLAGCSQGTPPPRRWTTRRRSRKSVEATLGVETAITVNRLSIRTLEGGGSQGQAGEDSDKSRPVPPGDVLPDRRSTVRSCRSTASRAQAEAKGAAKTVGLRRVTCLVPRRTSWSPSDGPGWPAFFRSGDTIVIFVTEKGTKTARPRHKVSTLREDLLGDAVRRWQDAADAPRFETSHSVATGGPRQ